MALIASSPQVQRYRPVQSLLMWAFGSIDRDWPWPWIRVLGLLCYIPYLLSALLWAYSTQLSRSGCLAVAVVMVVHPGLSGPLASIDGFASQLSMGIVWLGLWLAFALGQRLIVATLVCGVTMAMAIVTKEYSVGMIPLVILMALCLRHDRRVLGALVMAAAASLMVGGFMLARLWVAPPEDTGVAAFFSYSPVAWLQQEAMLLVAALFVGNTVWVFVNAGAMAFAVLFSGIAAFVLWLAAGIYLNLRVHGLRSGSDRNETPRERTLQPHRWMIFYALTLLAGGLPGCLVWKVSEMYAIGMILPVALLSGLAIDGWCKTRGKTRLLGLLAGGATIVVSLLSTLQKIEGVRSVGERAAHQLRQVVGLLPTGIHDVDIALVYRHEELPARRKYSVFHLGDDHLLTTLTLDWPRYGQNLKVRPVYFSSSKPPDLAGYVYALLWRADTETFERLDVADVPVTE